MIVDCNKCSVRGDACRDCLVTVLLGMPTVREAGGVPVGEAAATFTMDQEEQAAMAALAEVGMVPRLRLVTSQSSQDLLDLAPNRTVCDGRRIG